MWTWWNIEYLYGRKMSFEAVPFYTCSDDESEDEDYQTSPPPKKKNDLEVMG